MEAILDHIFGLIPAVLVFLTAYIFFNRMTKNHETQLSEMKNMLLKKETIGIKISAYERLILMLERINPTNMVMRLSNGSMTGTQLQLLLLKTIREEFEHNISQQMYVSNQAWELISDAREDTSNLIKLAVTQTKPNGSALDLSRQIFDLEQKSKNMALRRAIYFLKQEIAKEM